VLPPPGSPGFCLSTAAVILAGGFLSSLSADLMSDAPGCGSIFPVVAKRDGLENLLASAISYSFDRF
jgi:hypothetical protein